MDDQRVAQPLATTSGSTTLFETLERHVRHRERHLHLEQIAEHAEARIEQDVADLRDHLARRGVDRERQRRLVGQQLLEDAAALC